MNFQALRQDLDHGIRQNFYIFTGDEREVMRQYIKRIDPNPIGANSFQELSSRLQTVGLFNKGEHGTYVLYNDKTVFEWNSTELLHRIGTDKVILVYDKIDNRILFFKKMSSFIYEFNKFTEQQLAGYIQGRIEIDYPLAIQLALYCNNEVARVDSELHKLRHADATISRELIDDIVTPTPTDQVFAMADAIALNNITKAFSLYEDLMELNESPIGILAVLYLKFKQIFLVQAMSHLSNADICEKTGLNNWAVLNTRDCVGAFDLDQLIRILKLIQQTEVAMKTGQVDIQYGLRYLLVKLLWRNL